MTRLEPGEVAAIAILAGGLTASAVLVAFGCEPTSTCVRRSKPLKAAYGIMFLHMAITIPGDPLTGAGRMIEQLTLARRTGQLPKVPGGRYGRTTISGPRHIRSSKAVLLTR